MPYGGQTFSDRVFCGRRDAYIDGKLVATFDKVTCHKPDSCAAVGNEDRYMDKVHIPSDSVHKVKCPDLFRPYDRDIDGSILTTYGGGTSTIYPTADGGVYRGQYKCHRDSDPPRYFRACVASYADPETELEYTKKCCTGEADEDKHNLTLYQEQYRNFNYTGRVRCRPEYTAGTQACNNIMNEWCKKSDNIWTDECIAHYNSENTPGGKQLQDQRVAEYCERNPQDERCACFNIDPEFEADIPLPHCFYKPCTLSATAYKTQNMLNTQCPDLMRCDQYLNLSEGARQNVMNNTTLEQSCSSDNNFPDPDPDPTDPDPTDPDPEPIADNQRTMIILFIAFIFLIAFSLGGSPKKKYELQRMPQQGMPQQGMSQQGMPQQGMSQQIPM